MTETQLIELLKATWGRFANFFTEHFDVIVAAVVLILGYRLIRLGIEVAADSEGRPRDYLVRFVPGAAFAIFGMVFLMGRDPISLIVYWLTITVAVGFGFAFLGYRLFLEGVLKNSDSEGIFRDRELLVRRAAPGTLFALFGLVMICVWLWKGPGILRDYNERGQRIQEQSLKAIDERSRVTLEMLQRALEVKPGQQADQVVGQQQQAAKK